MSKTGIWFIQLNLNYKRNGHWELLGVRNSVDFSQFSLALRRLMFSRGLEVMWEALGLDNGPVKTSSNVMTITSEITPVNSSKDS